jgi:integrase
VKQGTVYQRHGAGCPRQPDGSYAKHRCKGSWTYLIDLGRDPSGKRRQRGKGGFPTKAAARAALQEVVSLQMADVDLHRLTVAEYLNGWLAGKHALKPSTAAHYRDALDLYLLPHLGPLRLLELRAHHLDRLYAAISVGKSGRPLSPSSVRRVHAALRSALNTAVKRRLIPYNPALHVELAPETPRRVQPWTPEQCRTFLDLIGDDRLAVLYELLIVTGLRRGEAVGLRWADVDLDDHCLIVRQQITDVRGKLVVGAPKTRRGARMIPLDEHTVMRLRRHLVAQQAEREVWGEAWHETGLVFTRGDGRPLRPEYVTRHFQALARAAGLPVIRLHDLRHTNASMALAAGIDIKVVSERLGHSTTAITSDLYTHVVPTVGRQAALQLADALGRAGSAADDYEMTTKEAAAPPERSSGHASLQVEQARPKGLEPLTF